MKNEILYSRLKLQNLPKGARIELCVDLNEVYYREKQDRVVITSIEDCQLGPFKEFIKPKLLADDNEWINISLEIDSDIFTSSKMLQNRKLFFSIMRRCYQENIYNYLSHLTLNLVEDTLNRYKLDDVPWMISKEFGTLKNFYQYPKNTTKLGNTFIDLNNGVFYESPKNEEISMKGGILLDKSNYHWINKIKKLIDMTSQDGHNGPKRHKGYKMNTESTLIVCSQLMIQSWKDLLTDAIVIAEKRDHKNVTYDDILNSRVVIVSNEYLTNKNYAKVWDNFKINDDASMKDIFTIMYNEYAKYAEYKFTDIKKLGNPVLSLIGWKRLVVDSHTVGMASNDPFLLELIGTLDSSYRWVQLASFPFMRDDVTQIINMISGKTINYPLYKQDGRVHHLNDIVRCIDQHDDKLRIDKQVINISTNKYENELLSSMTSDEANDILFNFKTKSDIKKMGINCPSLRSNGHPECSICLTTIKRDSISITKCGHEFCFSCIIENLKYSKSCPLCRKEIDHKSIYTITRLTTMSSKMAKLHSLLKSNSKEKSIIYVKNIKEGQYLSKFMDKRSIKNVLCTGGRIQRKNQLINEFNDNTEPCNIILVIDDHPISKSIKGIQNVYFLDDWKAQNMQDYCGYGYLHTEIDSIKIYVIKQIIKKID